ncbi:MAG: fatty acid cis/trans isomerase, partial [Erysipelotrichaceae bacterium]|nr:fatty acid cis/trans isomerase [Erysipelotrichaceae bacterium]
MKRYAFLFVSVPVIFIIECGAYKTDVSKAKFGKTRYVNRTVEVHKPDEVSFVDDVKPILESRCGVCHSCYDAPCQLKLTSFEGLDRGATKDPLYNATRLTAMSPTRLFIDEKSTPKWRKRGFHPVINERNQTPEINLENSVINLMLTLKQTHPQPETVLLPSSFDISLDKNPVCPTVETFPEYKGKYPLWGMPYALPGVSQKEHDTITKWLEEGARTTLPPPLSQQASTTIAKWETFLNGKSLKEKLMSRYIYEHLFIGHIHFDNLPDREFYRLVRSSTAPGETVDEINTVRPYDDPITRHFYYRFRRIDHAIPVKNHTVYHMSDDVMKRYEELFLAPDYEVEKLPGYKADVAANPFKTFEAIPAKSRYKFLLDNARFFVMGFIKGPVCRGQVALNVINDHFFVAFFDPDRDA